MKYTYKHNVIVNIFFLSEKATGKSTILARLYFIETPELTHCWIMLWSQWFNIVIYFDWHQKPSRTVNVKTLEKNHLQNGLIDLMSFKMQDNNLIKSDSSIKELIWSLALFPKWLCFTQ